MNLPLVVIDGSALFAILLGAPQADRCREILENADRLLLSAGSLAELLIVAEGKNTRPAMDRMIELIQPEVVALTADRTRAAANAYRRWGKGFHRAALNISDSFAYALAIERGCPLLFVGNDFAQTDVMSALG